MTLDRFKAVWVVDFEFDASPGDRPRPVCLVARETRSGRLVRMWREDLLDQLEPPYDLGPDTLFVAYFASAEMACHAVLGWSLPEAILDLFCEFRVLTNGRPPTCGNGLLGACQFYGIDVMAPAEKDAMRDLVLRGGAYTAEERLQILDYCEADVTVTAQLLERMAASIDLDRALLRGRYMAAVARIEHNGVPIDVDRLQRLRAGWHTIKSELIAEVDKDYGVFEGESFRAERWARWLAEHGVAWPRLTTGRLDLSDETFRAMAKVDTRVSPMRELRSSLSTMRLEDVAVGIDGRNRTLISPFKAITGRNAPSNTKFIFGPAVWLRGLIRPSPGWAVAYIDWSQQEWGIAAALSGDRAMIDAYLSGDPYLAFAIQAGGAPQGATKASHGHVRELFKQAALAVQYGMGALSLSQRIGCIEGGARDLLADHRRTYRTLWAWSDGAVDTAVLGGRLWTTYGWQVQVGAVVNPRSLRNFPVQGNGAEMLRIACIRATEAGVRVCAPVHDALLVEAPIDEIDDVVEATKAHMARASLDVLGNLELRSDAVIVRHPERYMDERGRRMWDAVWDILDRVQGGER